MKKCLSILTRYSLLYFLLMISFLVSGQEITGTVLDSRTKAPLSGASVYFNNTTLGTITNEKGEFSLEYPSALKTQLVVSFLGYESFYKVDFTNTIDLLILLKESYNTLDEVVLSPLDDWSRELKLSEFKKHYLGESEAGRNCLILNEEDLRISFNSESKTLTAWSNAPIVIQNNYLGYFVSVDLSKFQAQYSSVSKNKKRLSIQSVTYLGSNQYKSMNKETEEELFSKRAMSYLGSTLHFMRALVAKQLNEEGFEIFLEKGNRSYKQWIKTTSAKGEDGVVVSFPKKYNIRYRGTRQSSIECLDESFYIDGFGNHSPPDRVIFTGDFGDQRMGDALPLDYFLQRLE